MKRHFRSIALIFAFIIGSCFHQELANLRALMPLSIGLMLFITFLGIDARKLEPRREHLKLLGIMPIITLICWGIPSYFGYPILAESLFFCAAAPIATASPIITKLLGARVEFITTAMLLSHLIFIIVTPLILPLILNGEYMNYGTLSLFIFEQISYILLIPALLAFLVRKFYPASFLWSKKTTDLSLTIWLFNLCIISAVGTTNIIAISLSLWELLPLILASLFLCIFNFTFGYFIGKPHYALEFSQGLGQKNTILTLFIASQPFAHPLAYIAPLFYVLFHNVANAIQLSRVKRKE